MLGTRINAIVVLILSCVSTTFALERADANFRVFQFPADKIPRIDGNADDWAIVPDEYAIGTDKLAADNGSGRKPDPKSIDVKVKVGWVKGLNRLYFLYEATDNYWDFSRPGLDQDIFELAVDGNASGGPFIARYISTSQPGKPADLRDAWYNFQGHHAQNYHIFTPAVGKDWCMAWGPQSDWIKKLPYSNCAYNYTFKPGESGKLIMEFWITPFDEAPADGPKGAVESQLKENATIGLCWAILDYDDVNTSAHGFWNLSPRHTMYGQASELCAFKLMPLEASVQKKLDADWSFKVTDLDKRIVAFHDESAGKVTTWKWDFGDGTTSTEQNPTHTYAKTGNYIVILSVEGPDGKSQRSRVWDVTLQ
ncbi:MAG TPA: PKD domain-containing protein [Tepidisphaeraceae bacterium]|nr:PKD domain-containing protein [Tepidisphaeraceae bacterium]